MQNVVNLHINNYQFQVGIDSINSHIIREDDEISIEIYIDNQNTDVSIFLEDFEPEINLTPKSSGFVYYIPQRRYFLECFGQAHVRIYISEETYDILFDVRAKKTSAAAASKMIQYLASHHESIINSCLSRSSVLVGNQEGSINNPEALIAAAESYTSALLVHRTELLTIKKTRLAPVRQSLWKSTKSITEIDPIDIINNLNTISPNNSEGDLILRGKYFSIGDIDIWAIKETANVFENQILLGGLYSIKEKINNITNQLNQLNQLNHNSPFKKPLDGYESLDQVLLNLTSSGMIKRCNEVIELTNKLIRLFELKIGVNYAGDIRPVMTPYARTSKIYRALYSNLAKWYELGMPSFGLINSLMKLKSLSKIYEIYALFKIIDQMNSTGWEVIQSNAHPDLGEFIPKEVKLKRDGVTTTIFYEPIIKPFNTATNHLDLIDVAHTRVDADFNYWNPDYVIRLDGENGYTKYIIADAKYSTESTVRDIHLPKIIEKYYWGMSVYNSIIGSYSNDSICAIIAIYPPIKSRYFLPYGKRKSIGGNKPTPLPIIGAVGLTIESENTFESVLSEIFDNIHFVFK